MTVVATPPGRPVGARALARLLRTPRSSRSRASRGAPLAFPTTGQSACLSIRLPCATSAGRRSSRPGSTRTSSPPPSRCASPRCIATASTCSGRAARGASPTGAALPTAEVAVGDWLLLDGAGRPLRAARAQVADRAPGGRDRGRDAADRRQPRHAVHRQLVQRRLQPRPARALPRAGAAGRGAAGGGADQGRRLRRSGRLRRPGAGARRGAADRGGERARPGAVARLEAWCGRGETVALAGSSGVGKSTLTNALTGAALATRGIREDDARGRHTTTARSLHRTRAGGWLIDTPGMRALRLADAPRGSTRCSTTSPRWPRTAASATAATTTSPAARCRRRSRPAPRSGAAVRWRKLAREDARNTATLAEARARERAQGRFHARSRGR